MFASRSFHAIDDAPFRLFCDHFLMANERTTATSLRLQLNGGEHCDARLSIIPRNRGGLPRIKVIIGGDAIMPRRGDNGRLDFKVPATAQLFVTW